MSRVTDSNFDDKLIRKLATLLKETGLSEIEYENDGFKIRVAKHFQELPHSNSEIITVKETLTKTDNKKSSSGNKQEFTLVPGTITSPMVGVAYLSSGPKAAPFVKEGDKVVVNQTLMLIEAMKVFNEIKATKAGTIEKILIENGSPVEFGEPLIIIT